jgi:hypothetical protein
MICYSKMLCYWVFCFGLFVWKTIKSAILFLMKIIIPILLGLTLMLGIAVFANSNNFALLGIPLLILVIINLFGWYKRLFEFIDIDLSFDIYQIKRKYKAFDPHKYGAKEYIATDKCDQIMKCNKCGTIKDVAPHLHIWGAWRHNSGDCCALERTCARCDDIDTDSTHKWNNGICNGCGENRYQRGDDLDYQDYSDQRWCADDYH